MAEVEKLKGLFKDFVTANEKYEENLETDEDLDESESYFTLVQNEYINTLTAANEYKRNKPQVVETEQKMTNSDLLKIMNLPKLTLENFDGNPVNFHTFIATFDQHVDVAVTNGDTKLSRLLQYTTGAAKEAIRKCALIGGDAGYKKARETLVSRFGNDHIVAEKLMSDIKNGKQVRSPIELRHFADDLENSLVILNKMGKLPELDTQSAIIEILTRLQPYVQSRWKRFALDTKKDKDAYPTL